MTEQFQGLPLGVYFKEATGKAIPFYYFCSFCLFTVNLLVIVTVSL